MTECVIRSVNFDEKGLKPINLKFQNGQLLDGKAQELSAGIYKTNTNSVIPILASESIVYRGQLTNEYNYNTFIAIKNKKTNKMRLVAIDQALLKSQPPKTSDMIDSTMMEANKSTVLELHKEFGSKKIKRQIEQNERLKVNVENFKDQLEKTVADIQLDEIDFGDKPQTSDLLPMINKEAENVRDVYVLETIIPMKVFKSLQESANGVLAATREELKTTEYVTERLLNLQKIEADDAVRTASVLLIIDSLLRIGMTSAKDISNRNFVVSPYSKELNDFVLNTFTFKTGKTRTRPMSMRDKTACYILVLSLLINRYTVKIEELGTILKIGKKKMQDFCRMLLLNVTSTSATLKLPLPAPPSFGKPPNRARK